VFEGRRANNNANLSFVSGEKERRGSEKAKERKRENKEKVKTKRK